jgi:thioredoxin-related protein
MTNYKSMLYLLLLGLIVILPTQPNYASTEKVSGKITGVVSHPMPNWFKDSFLDFADDVDEATSKGKHVMLFFHLEACPYCTRMLVESFEPELLSKRIQKNFDVIEVNIKGDRLIQFNETLALSEKQLAETLGVQATPAIVFLNKDNKFITRVNGYRSPSRFEQVLNYVSTNAYASVSLESYMQENLKRNVYTLRDHSLFSSDTDLSVDGPVAVIIEDTSCNDCAELHARMLGRDDILQQLEKFTVIRFNAETDAQIRGLDGQVTNVREFISHHKILYRPAILLIDDATIVKRYDSLPFSYHFREGLRFVADGFYKNELYKDYSERRRDELLAAGVNINYKE